MEQNRRRERIGKIIKRTEEITEEERKRKEEESALLCRSCVPDLLNDEPILLLTNHPAPALEEKEKTQENQYDHMTDYYPPSPIYVASYEEENAPTLVNNLIPKPTP